jgi:hypothetical protein
MSSEIPPINMPFFDGVRQGQRERREQHEQHEPHHEHGASN